MPNSDLMEIVVTCPVCHATWKIVYTNSSPAPIFVKCQCCKECFEVKV